MEMLNELLPVLINVFLVILLIVFIILGIKMIQILNRVEKIVEDVEEKMSALDGMFKLITQAASNVTMFGDLISGAINKVKTIILKKKEEE